MTVSRERFLAVHDALCQEHGCPIDWFSSKDPLSELVSALLSHRTKNADSARAYRALRDRFPSWEAVRDAPTPEVEAAIAPCTWPEQKAPRLQAVLKAIGDRRPAPDLFTAEAPGARGLSLDWLADLGVREARAWLETIPGVGPKTSAAVLLFSRLRMPALPVDSHHHRVAQRLGWIPEKMPVGPSHEALEAMLPEEWGAREVYDHHEVLMLHGQRVCHWRTPECERCVVLELCPFGQRRQEKVTSVET
ncbi:endonuclease III domain-containing protein [Rubricoccus marinus]|uniref:Fe-S cluster assembly protein HesB n=1 Tax=Rubricoccus marinus TaxID=716817 RepID=A0A259TZ06_9BACT|nr:Fe-S cluster assembly protein HesB [Rubricoccus marinus]OZC02916.1 Fe-S cluster assembly protein HesB [Rubricoccus marinus]